MICWFYPTNISQTARIIFELKMTKIFAPFMVIFIVLRKAPLLFVKLIRVVITTHSFHHPQLYYV